MEAGETFTFSEGDHHLWMVISEPQLDREQVLGVHFASWDECWDQACIVSPGEHRFVTHKTIVAYDRAFVATDATWERAKAAGKIVPYGFPLSANLLDKIRHCAFHSRIKRDWFHLLMEQGLIDAKRLRATE
jgi:hypothetical protein